MDQFFPETISLETACDTLMHGCEVEVFDRRFAIRARRAGREALLALRCGYISSSCRTFPSAPQRR